MNFFSEEQTKVLLFILNYMAGTTKFTGKEVKTSTSTLYKVYRKGQGLGSFYWYPNITLEDLGNDILFMLGVPYISHNYTNLFIES